MKGKGQGQSGRSSPRRVEPTESRSRLDPGAHVHRGPAGSSPRILIIKGREAEDSPNRSKSLLRKKAKYWPHGKATKRPSPHTDPVIVTEENISSGKKEAPQVSTNSSPKRRICLTYGKR